MSLKPWVEEDFDGLLGAQQFHPGGVLRKGQGVRN
jgi:hypothetical protein